MRTFAILGGMTPDVTALYYRTINQHVRQALGKRHSARMYVFSVDLESQLQRAEQGDWTAFAKEYLDALKPLVTTTSEARPAISGVAISAILAHRVAQDIRSMLPPSVELLHVADAVAEAIKAKGITTVGLIGPKPTMTDTSPDYFIGKLAADHGLQVLVPTDATEIDTINRGMFAEVVRGADAVTPATARMFRTAAEKLIQRGAQGLILGSTDLGFVLSQADFDVPVLDAAVVHARAVADWALQA